MDRFPSNLGHTSLWLSLSDTYYSCLPAGIFKTHNPFLNSTFFQMHMHKKQSINHSKDRKQVATKAATSSEKHGRAARGSRSSAGVRVGIALCPATANSWTEPAQNSPRLLSRTQLGFGLAGQFLFSFSHNSIKQRQGHAGIWNHLLNWRSVSNVKDESPGIVFFFCFRAMSLSETRGGGQNKRNTNIMQSITIP